MLLLEPVASWGRIPQEVAGREGVGGVSLLALGVASPGYRGVVHGRFGRDISLRWDTVPSLVRAVWGCRSFVCDTLHLLFCLLSGRLATIRIFSSTKDRKEISCFAQLD